MSAVVRCTSCGQLNRWPALATATTRVRCATCKTDLARPLSMGGGSAFASSPFDDVDDDDLDDLDDDDLDDDDDDDGGDR
jgi:ribosomal protein S27E